MGRWLLILLVAAALAPLSSHVVKPDVAYTHAPGKIRSSWGKRLNPAGAIPDSGFEAIYFNSGNRGDIVFKEQVDSIAINYAWSDFHQIPSENFEAYWVGKLDFTVATTKQFSVSQSWAKSRIIIDGETVFDERNSSKTFTHRFEPGRHVIEVEYSNHWHTVEYKVTIEDVVEKLSESDLAARLTAQSRGSADLYYVGLYESQSKDTSVDVTLPDTGRPAVLWLASYEAIDWNIDALPPGSTVILSSYAPGSRARGPGVEQVLHSDRYWAVYSETKGCSCVGGRYHCENSEDLNDVARKLADLTGMRLSGYAMKYSAAAITVRPYAAAAARGEQSAAQDAERRQCSGEPDPDTTPW